MSAYRLCSLLLICLSMWGMGPSGRCGYAHVLHATCTFATIPQLILFTDLEVPVLLKDPAVSVQGLYGLQIRAVI
jgi:hypothetical protein